jgi:hypothetical protein
MIQATKEDVEEALERDLTDDEVDKLPGRVAKASDLVEGFLGFDYVTTDLSDPPNPDFVPDVVPDKVVRVVAGAVARLYAAEDAGTPSFVESQSQAAGAFSATTRFSADVTNGKAPWLTKTDKARLRSVFSGMRSVASGSDRR